MPSSRFPVWKKTSRVRIPFPSPSKMKQAINTAGLSWVLNLPALGGLYASGGDYTSSLFQGAVPQCSPETELVRVPQKMGGDGIATSGHLCSLFCQGFQVWDPGEKGIVTTLEALTLDGIQMHLPI